MIENKKINERNINKFKVFGCFSEKYICCLCGKECFTDESYSNRGDRLICSTCYYTNFKNCVDARNWINRKEVTNNADV